VKNYLFAPFKDDEEKIEEFNHFKNYLSSGHRNSLIMFIGRLESYYDVIIGELRSKLATSIKDEEIITSLGSELKDEKYYCKEMVSKLQAEIKTLKADDKELKAENGKLRSKVIEHEEYYKTLETRFYNCYADNDKLKTEDDRHKERYAELAVKYDACLVANGELLQSNLKLRSNSYDD
jgi:chromosome segregation ATPase|tara:strand:- start:193 stop:729 length:537 start_codon:yes stop_codon:yes gene_type:complete